MDARDFFAWRSNTTSVEPLIGEEDLAADVDEPPEHKMMFQTTTPDFHKSTVRPQPDRKESLLTKAFQKPTPIVEIPRPRAQLSIDSSRRRSVMSIASAASTADLTSDGGITSPARTNTPSPPIPSSTRMSFMNYDLGPKLAHGTPPIVKISSTQRHDVATVPKLDPAVEALVKKRCISFACGPPKIPTTRQDVPAEKEKPKKTCSIKFACLGPKPTKTSPPILEKEQAPAPAAKKTCSIKFACAGPKPTTPSSPVVENEKAEPLEDNMSIPTKAPRHTSRSPSVTKKQRLETPTLKQRDSSSTIRRSSYSPAATRTRKPVYIADNTAVRSEATTFHEFASEETLEEDWIRTDKSEEKVKLTINDTLKKENAFRQLGEEAEEEALQDDEDDDDLILDDSDEDDEIDDIDDFDDETVDGSDENASDGNETDNEAGFAESDDENDAHGDWAFWTPGRSVLGNFDTVPNIGQNIQHRAASRRTASESSIDSLKHMSPLSGAKGKKSRRSRKIRIRPGTPDLPDSTDFVCGTLDEDRPLEDAYVSCMEARKREKHHMIPQDIDPSFPTSDPEDEEDDEDIHESKASDEELWLHGKFEDSDEDGTLRHRPVRKSPTESPKRLHSPPPKNRIRSPAPRRLFGPHSPRRLRSPAPARTIRSPATSPTSKVTSIAFAPLGQRPGLTHTKSLPRTPNAFCRAYHASRLIAANGNITHGVDGEEEEDNTDIHTRGAIDIVKGLESKRLRRKEKFYQKQCNRARKGQQAEKPRLAGKGVERMRELGLQMAGRTDTRLGKAEYVLSV